MRQSNARSCVRIAGKNAWRIAIFGALWMAEGAPLYAQWTGGPSGPVYYNGGNVGIGTSSPSRVLDVAGSVWIGAGSSSTDVRPDTHKHLILGDSTSTSIGILDLVSNVSATGSYTGGVQIANYNLSATDKRIAAIYGALDSAANSGQLQFWTWNAGAAAEKMRITSTGNVGIGTANPQYLLSVNGTIGAKDVTVTSTGWSDYVFDPAYRLQPLTEVRDYIQANHHLPNIPSEAEVKEKGVSVGEMQAKLLAKIEELTLHMIRQEDENRQLRERLARLEDHTTRATPAGK